jgi:hypothetical protein
MKKRFIILLACGAFANAPGQRDSITPAQDKSALRFNISADGSRYFQVTFSNQTWLRYNESNPGTTLFGKKAPETFDVGLRRTRMQMFGPIHDRAFVYFQFGQNNFNNTAGYAAAGGNRKIAAFFHDALCEFSAFKADGRAGKGNALKLGAGLTVVNALSRFSQPSISSIMTLDVPVFLQFTVDQTDQFDRRLAAYARGQVSKLDYRVYVSNPFPVNSNGNAAPGLGRVATFYNPALLPNGTGPGIQNQYGAYFTWNFLEMEPHTTPYMAGTYLGAKRVFNIAAGACYQKAATWNLAQNTAGVFADTSYNDMLHFSVESYLDVPLNKEKGTAFSAFAGYYNFNYGFNYLRYNGLMNPATGSTAKDLVQNSAYGNAFPMFGTGQVVYAQAGCLLPASLIGNGNGQLMPFASGQFADYAALQNKPMLLFDLGVNWFIKGHNAKLSLDYQNRPTFLTDNLGNVKNGVRRSCVILQYQIAI